MRALTFILCLALLGGCQTTGSGRDADKSDRRADLHYQLGLDALNKGNLPRAFDELLQAEHLAPERTDVLDALGLAWRLRGDLEKAEAYYRRALKLNPAPATYNNYGSLLLQQGRAKEAEAYFREALGDPRYRRPDLAYINLGDALLAQDRFNDAIAAYRQAKVLNPQQETARLREAEAYVRYHRPRFAQAMYETILRERPGFRPAIQALLALLEEGGHLVEAREQLKHFLGVTSDPLDRAWAEQELARISIHD